MYLKITCTCTCTLSSRVQCTCTPSEDILELFMNLILLVFMSSVLHIFMPSVFSSHVSCLQSSVFISPYLVWVSVPESFTFLWTSCFIFNLIFSSLVQFPFKEIHVHDEELHHRPPRPPRQQKKPASTGPCKTPSPPVSKLTKNISSSSSN